LFAVHKSSTVAAAAIGGGRAAHCPWHEMKPSIMQRLGTFLWTFFFGFVGKVLNFWMVSFFYVHAGVFLFILQRTHTHTHTHIYTVKVPNEKNNIVIFTFTKKKHEKVSLGKKINFFLRFCLASHRFNDAKKKRPGKKWTRKKLDRQTFSTSLLLSKGMEEVLVVSNITRGACDQIHGSQNQYTVCKVLILPPIKSN